MRTGSRRKYTKAPFAELLRQGGGFSLGLKAADYIGIGLSFLGFFM